MRFPAEPAIGFHLVDYVVHGWDVARTLGLRYDLEPGLLAATLRIARQVPDGPNRRPTWLKVIPLLTPGSPSPHMALYSMRDSR